MSQKLHWLVYILIEGNVVPHEICIKLLEDLGDDVSAEIFAQEIYNMASGSMGEKEAKKLLDRVEEAIELAVEMTSKGESVPELFADQNGNSPTNTVDVVDDDVSDQVVEDCDVEEDSDVLQLLIDLINGAIEAKAGNLHIKAEYPPFFQKFSFIEYLSETPLKKEEATTVNTSFLSVDQKENLLNNKELVLTANLKGYLCRVSLYICDGSVDAIYHLLPKHIKTLKELNYNSEIYTSVENIIDFGPGLLLVSGLKNSGKTSTIAALIDLINKSQKKHILSVGKHIELLHTADRCSISQKEIGRHTLSYADALNGTGMEDADVVVVDDIEDAESVELILNAVNRGQFVIAGIVAADCVSVINRLISFFPEEKHELLRKDIAQVLKGIICQKLLPDISKNAALALEFLFNTVPIAGNISDGKFYLLKPAMQVDKKFGMCMMDDYIYELFREGTLNSKVAIQNIVNKKQYEKMISSSKL